MPRGFQALLAALSVALVLLVIGLVVQDVVWQVRHPAEAHAADQAAFNDYWLGLHQLLLQRQALHRSIWPCAPCPACPP